MNSLIIKPGGKWESILRKIPTKGRRRNNGYPVATLAYYGPTDQKATKLVVGIIHQEHADPDQMKKWFSDGDIREEYDIFEKVMDFIRTNGAGTVVVSDRIIGCPHESGIDYPEGQYCPLCPFWEGRNRWTGRVEH